MPEMYELNSAPTTYSKELGGVRAGREVVCLFPGALEVLRSLATEGRFLDIQVAVASSTTEVAFAHTCLDAPVVATDDKGVKTTLGQLVKYREVYPACKGAKHFPALQRASSIDYSDMLFFDDCTYGDNCAAVATECAGVSCVRTPEGLTVALFTAGLQAFASGKQGVIA